jgi:thymidine phosphorylase
MTLHTDEPERFERALASLDGAVEITTVESTYTPTPIVLDRVS